MFFFAFEWRSGGVKARRSLSRNSRHAAAHLQCPKSLLFLLIMFSCLKPYARARERGLWWWEKRLSSKNKFITRREETTPNYIITKWGIFSSDYQFEACECLGVAQRQASLSPTRYFLSYARDRSHCLNSLCRKSIQCHFIYFSMNEGFNYVRSKIPQTEKEFNDWSGKALKKTKIHCCRRKKSLNSDAQLASPTTMRFVTR